MKHVHTVTCPYRGGHWELVPRIIGDFTRVHDSHFTIWMCITCQHTCIMCLWHVAQFWVESYLETTRIAQRCDERVSDCHTLSFDITARILKWWCVVKIFLGTRIHIYFHVCDTCKHHIMPYVTATCDPTCTEHALVYVYHSICVLRSATCHIQ